MGNKKYRSDYKLRYDADDKGRIKADAVYTGSLYRFAADADVRQRGAKRTALFTAAAWLAWLLPLLVKSAAAHAFYVIFPHVGSGIALWYLALGAAAFVRSGEPLSRQQSEQLQNRLGGGSAVGMALALISFAGCAVFMLNSGAAAGDMVFALGAAAQAGCCLMAWRERDTARTVAALPETDPAEKYGA
ncbi:MAG: hypothetical protein IKV55_00020 [Oscillospiraceae bacterium]|nr:hypothetical protein [Oscillospiraceae bacterium]